MNKALKVKKIKWNETRYCRAERIKLALSLSLSLAPCFNIGVQMRNSVMAIQMSSNNDKNVTKGDFLVSKGLAIANVILTGHASMLEARMRYL